MSPQSRLIPIRIDAWAADKSTRLVDTILFDPTCWPVTKHTSDPSVWIEETTQCLVDTALLDVDVMGMERERTAPSSLASAPNNNKFVGRLDVWNFSLQQRLCDQVRSQLWRILLESDNKPLAPSSKPTKNDGASERVITAGNNKRATVGGDNREDTEDRPAKRMRLPEDSSDKQAGSGEQEAKEAFDNNNTPNPLAGTDAAPLNVPSQAERGDTEEKVGSDEDTPTAGGSMVQKNKNTGGEVGVADKDMNLAGKARREAAADIKDPIYQVTNAGLEHLVPIRIRLSAFGIRIHDDFYIDPSMEDLSPLSLAKMIATDLNLNDDLIVALTTHIAEQMYGVQPDQEPILTAYDMEQGATQSTEQQLLTAAYKIDHNVHIANVAHLVQEHRS